MNFKVLYQVYIFSFSFFIFGCLADNPWEELESDYDHILNVFGLISLDSSQTSYIGIYRTTDLNETSQNFIGVDTLGWCDCENEECYCEDEDSGYWIIDSLYEPAALIKDATVIVSDETGNDYEFSFLDKITLVDTIYFDTTFTFYGTTIEWDTTIYDTNNFRINFYVDLTGTFNPQPNMQYELSIDASGFDPVSGSLRTPYVPSLDSLVQEGSSIDTLRINEPFEIFWTSQPGLKGFLTGEVIFGNWWEDSLNGRSDCGYFDPFIIDYSDNNQNPSSVYPWICNETEETFPVRDYFIRLTSMDENYYEYFIIGESGEYSNALLNYPTTKGRSVGIEGGFGFFGSIASDVLILKISP